MLTALRRRRPAEPILPPPGPGDEILERRLDRDRVIDRFDADYLDDLPGKQAEGLRLGDGPGADPEAVNAVNAVQSGYWIARVGQVAVRIRKD